MTSFVGVTNDVVPPSRVDSRGDEADHDPASAGSSQDLRQVARTVEQTLPGDLSMEDWQARKEVIAAVSQPFPDAASQPPGFVFSHVPSALKQAQAKTINNVENDLFIHSGLTR